MRTFTTLSVFAILASNAMGDDLPEILRQTTAMVDFENDLIPVFTRSGCNAGACHGAAIGRGGFKLSLYGGDPKADYQSIVLELEGRRVNLVRPDTSLIVLKPTEVVEHGGGSRLDSGGAGAQRLLNWIKQGTPHLLQEAERSLPLLALLAGTDQRVEGGHIWL